MLSSFVNIYGITSQIPALSQSFNFPSRVSHPITLIIILTLHFTFLNFSMSVLSCVSQKSTETQDVISQYLLDTKKYVSYLAINTFMMVPSISLAFSAATAT